MTGTYSLGLVALSLLVAILASYTALDLAKRIGRIQASAYRHFWLVGGALAMGVGIWAMHFIGMLAFHMPIKMGYDLWITLLSLAIAVVVSWFALYLASMKKLSLTHLLAGGVLMGMGIAAMHYTGMAAMAIHPAMSHDPWLFTTSVLIAITASIVALWMTFSLRADGRQYAFTRKIAAAAVMGFAITGMHYTGMAAARFAPESTSLAAQVDSTWLIITVSIISLSILTIAIILSMLDARFDSQNSKFTQSLQAANDKLLHFATHDALTDLPNRLVLTERIERAIHLARRSDRPFAVIYIDLDSFKMINDSLGHLVGDALLKSVTQRLLSILRKEDTLTRVGGDEFVLLVENLVQSENCLHICEQIQAAMRLPLEAGKTQLHITASIGVAIFPQDGDSVESLLHNADAAMYEVKRSGRNAYRYFEPAMNTNALRTLRIQADLHKALDTQELELYYQPKFIGDSLELNGAEALLRWKHKELGNISPSEFIPIAERSGLILEIGEWVIRQVCRQQVDWIKAGLEPIKIAVNLSAKHLRQRHLGTLILAIVQEYKLDPGLLMLEITESAVMEDAEENVATINQLQSIGFDVAIDDFGTGYSSLSYLQKFQVRQIKIDQFFVAGLDKNHAEGFAIVSAIIGLARALKMEVVAEGVEADSQLQKLMRLSCDQFQGYLLGKPMPAAEFTSLLGRRGMKRLSG